MEIAPLGHRPRDIQSGNVTTGNGVKRGIELRHPVEHHVVRIEVLTLGIVFGDPVRADEGTVERLAADGGSQGRQRGTHLVVAIFLGARTGAELFTQWGLKSLHFGTAADFHDVGPEELMAAELALDFATQVFDEDAALGIVGAERGQAGLCVIPQRARLWRRSGARVVRAADWGVFHRLTGDEGIEDRIHPHDAAGRDADHRSIKGFLRPVNHPRLGLRGGGNGKGLAAELISRCGLTGRSGIRHGRDPSDGHPASLTGIDLLRVQAVIIRLVGQKGLGGAGGNVGIGRAGQRQRGAIDELHLAPQQGGADRQGSRHAGHLHHTAVGGTFRHRDGSRG